MKDNISLVLCGQAGQGIQTVEVILTGIFKRAGYHVFATKEYMSRVRGGINTTSLRISSRPVKAYAAEIDILVSLIPQKTGHLQKRISSQTVAVAENNNMAAVGLVCGLFQVDQARVAEQVKKHFSAKGEKIVAENLQSVQIGFNKSKDLPAFDLKPDPAVAEHIILNGAEAVGLGALAGGCNFISAYPMSPSTGVLVFLSQQAQKFNLIAEQTEDEISAINMALGAWYAGARALVSTSGGGFALMIEGVSLAGMLELPLVIHLAQRPGPATGLPTRTEQGDLNLALYAGHGEFPRIILTPGSLAEAFNLTQKAFQLADKFQVPVFVLTDQYLLDSYYNLIPLNPGDLKIEPHFIQTEKDYQRYALAESGISPRGIPGYGEGLVSVDSDEHDEAGHITEDLSLRAEMVRKRLKKLESLKKESLEPEFRGAENYKILVIGWGSTRNIIKEAWQKLGRKDLACLHYRQVYPLPENTLSYLKKAEKVILIENNATSQFADLIKVQTGFEIKDRLNKFDGLPFSVEEIIKSLREI